MLNQQRLPVIIGKNGETKRLIEKLTRTRIEIDSKTGDVTIFPTDEKQSEEISAEELSRRAKIEETMLQRAEAEVKAESLAKEKTEEEAFSKERAEEEPHSGERAEEEPHSGEKAEEEPHSGEKAEEEPHSGEKIEEPALTLEEEEPLTFDGEELPQLENLGNLNVWIAENIIRAINRGFNPKKALRLLNEEYVLEIIDLEPILGHSEKAITRVKGRIIGESGSMRSAIEQFANCYISVFGNTISIIGQSDDTRVARKALQMLIQGVPHKNVYSFLEKKYKEKKDENIKKLWKPTF